MSDGISFTSLDMELPDGSMVRSYNTPVQDEAMVASLHKFMAAGATHVITIHAGPVLRKGDTIRLLGRPFEVMVIYDPYDEPGVQFPDENAANDIRDPAERQAAKEAILQTKAEMKASLPEQKGKWTKILIRVE